MTKEEEIEIAYALHAGMLNNVTLYRMRRFDEQGGRCFYCDVAMVKDDKFADHFCTADHRIPRARSGSDDYENIVASCSLCNNLKGPMTDTEYLESMAFVYRQARLRNEFCSYPADEIVAAYQKLT